MKRFVILFTLILSFEAKSQNPVTDSVQIARIMTEVLTRGTAYENLRYLCKKIGHRLTASRGMYAAEAWGQKALKEAGAERVWAQPCQAPHWIRGENEIMIPAVRHNNTIRIINPRNKFNILSLGNSEGTGKNGLAADILLIEDYKDLEIKRDQVKGKIVFYNYRFRQDFPETFQGYRDGGTYRTSGPSRAAALGAVAVIVRSVGSDLENHPHTGALRYNDSFPRIPAVAIGQKDADRLEAMTRAGNTLFMLRNTCRMLPDTLANNIIGEIRGSEFPDEIITIGGHLDSWDPAEGAHDDGAGIVQSMEVLNLFRAIGYKPKRTIRIVFFANEENGLRGATEYAKQAKINNEKHIMALESDAGGFTPRGFSGTMSAAQMEKLLSWKKLLEPYGIHRISSGGGGADIGPLNQAFGTPVIGLSPDSQRYFDVHHAESDVFESVNRRELHMGAGVMAALVYLVDRYGL
jgi:carboxypeptidase Q